MRSNKRLELVVVAKLINVDEMGRDLTRCCGRSLNAGNISMLTAGVNTLPKGDVSS